MGPTDRVVILIDMDCFYCQVEEKLNPKLKDKPVAVVQYNTWRGGGIIAVNYPARDEGVTRHMRGNEAKKKCPSINLVQVPEVRGKADLTKYRDAGKEVADVLATFTPLLQRASVDEAYLDITEQVEKRMASLNELTINNLSNTYVVGADLKDFLENVNSNKEFSIDNLKLAVGGLITEEIRREVFTKTGYRCSAGIAHNKVLAKLVCSLHKPNKQTILPQDQIEDFFQTMPINKIKSLGGKFGQTLSNDFQITFMSQLAKISEKELAQKYDEKSAKWLYNVARGIDNELVTTKLVAKSIACCKNFSGITALTTSENVEHWLHKLAEEMVERLDKDLKENNRKAKQVVVSFAQEINKQDVSSSRTHPLISYDSKKITRAAFEVIKKFCLRTDGSYHIKHMGLSAGHFEDVKNVREITTFFQVGQCKSNKKNSGNKVKSNIIRENDVTSDGIVDQNVYYQLTQELEENTDELIFYDDAFRVMSNNSITEELNMNTVSNDSKNSCDANLHEKSDVIESNKPLSSFFTKYFVHEPQASDQITIDELIEECETNENDFLEEVEEPTEICPECQKVIPITEVMSHQDYHFALNLVKNEKPQKPEVKVVTSGKKRGRSKNVTKKVDNNTLITFFKKDDELDSSVTEACTECNKRIKIEEMSSHLDYHTAKKIHLEINAIKSPVKFKNSTKIKQGKSKNQTVNRSVFSFFKPS